jgi:signal transduction histidine kinase
VLRQPIASIIANAETIRTRRAGPVAEDYAAYAGDIAAAGRHLLGCYDLADIEMIEASGFAPAVDRIDLADLARRAAACWRCARAKAYCHPHAGRGGASARAWRISPSVAGVAQPDWQCHPL